MRRWIAHWHMACICFAGAACAAWLGYWGLTGLLIVLAVMDIRAERLAIESDRRWELWTCETCGWKAVSRGAGAPEIPCDRCGGTGWSQR